MRTKSVDFFCYWPIYERVSFYFTQALFSLGYENLLNFTWLTMKFHNFNSITFSLRLCLCGIKQIHHKPGLVHQTFPLVLQTNHQQILLELQANPQIKVQMLQMYNLWIEQLHLKPGLFHKTYPLVPPTSP